MSRASPAKVGCGGGLASICLKSQQPATPQHYYIITSIGYLQKICLRLPFCWVGSSRSLSSSFLSISVSLLAPRRSLPSAHLHPSSQQPGESLSRDSCFPTQVGLHIDTLVP